MPVEPRDPQQSGHSVVVVVRPIGVHARQAGAQEDAPASSARRGRGARARRDRHPALPLHLIEMFGRCSICLGARARAGGILSECRKSVYAVQITRAAARACASQQSCRRIPYKATIITSRYLINPRTTVFTFYFSAPPRRTSHTSDTTVYRLQQKTRARRAPRARAPLAYAGRHV
jgi:hypothetical protein